MRVKKEEELEEVKRRAAEEAQRARLQREEEESGVKSKEQEQEQQIMEQGEAVEAESKGEMTVEETTVAVGTGGDASWLFSQNYILKARSETVGVACCNCGCSQVIYFAKKIL